MEKSRRRPANIRYKSFRRYFKKNKRLTRKSIIKMVLSLFILACAIIMKNADSPTAAALRNKARAVIGAGADYKEAVSVIGKAVTEKDGLQNIAQDEAIKVFGEKFLSPDDGKEKVGASAAGASGTDEVKYTDAPAQKEERSQMDLSLFGDDMQGGNMQISFLKYPLLVYESAAPEALPEVWESCLMPEEEVIDDTPATEFEIPSPDQVDETVYNLGFKYKGPLKSLVVTSDFGYRDHPIDGNTKFHYGVDYKASTGTPVYAFAAGTVAEIGTNSIYGKYVKISHSGGYLSFYGHLSSIKVKKGQKVKLSDLIGLAGSTGLATGSHLHFEIRLNDKILNPMQYLK